MLPVTVGAALGASPRCPPLNYVLRGIATIERKDKLSEEHCKPVSVLFDVGCSASQIQDNAFNSISLRRVW